MKVVYEREWANAIDTVGAFGYGYSIPFLEIIKI
tara:strand:+ start:937 stop:1038 length:102 start_codon:yes stop_codon:yes gene_type:complete